MRQLLRLKLLSQAAPNVNNFETFLLEDDDSSKMTIIKTKAQGDPENMVREVLREWLAGKEAWKNLISTLRDCKLLRVAEQIEAPLAKLK